MKDIIIRYTKKRRFIDNRLKILIFKPISKSFFGGPFMLQGAIEALKRIGHEVNIVDLEGCGSTPEERLERLIQKMADLSPDFVFTLNFIGFVPILIEVMEKMELPFVTWFVDPPFDYLKRGGSSSKFCVVFICDRAYIKGLKDLGFANIFYLPGATDPRVFKRLKLSEEEKKRFGCNISFIGTSHANSYSRYCQIIEDGNAQKVLSTALRMQIENPLFDISSILEEAQKLLPATVTFKGPKRSLELLIEEAAMAMYRKELIKSIARFGVHLYGDDGWSLLLDDRVKLFGPLDYYTELPKLYNASKINLNITPPWLKSAINQRVLDISACGAFILTDYRRDLSQLFRLGEEVICYHDKEELAKLAEYFLNHPHERKEIARQAQMRVLAEHTYEHRMEELVKTVRGLFG